MKTASLKEFFYPLVFLLFFTFSCKEDKNDDPVPGAEACRLDKIAFFENGVSDGSLIDVEYNSQGYVTKITEKEGSPAQVVEHTTFTYNSGNQMIREDYSQDGGNIEGYKTYEYNAEGLASKMIDQETGEEARTEVYTYDASKRVTQSVATQNGVSAKVVYRYPGAGPNFDKVTYYDRNNQVFATVTYENFDDKQNLGKALKGLVLIGLTTNNPGKVTYASFYQTESYNYTYKYNAAGFVTEAIEKKAGETEEYKTVYSYSGCK